LGCTREDAPPRRACEATELARPPRSMPPPWGKERGAVIRGGSRREIGRREGEPERAPTRAVARESEGHRERRGAWTCIIAREGGV
jgi:hypothetical protein